MRKSRNHSFRSLLAIGAMLALAACSGPPAPVSQAGPAYATPTAVATTTPSSGTDMLVGGVAGAAAGYMLANATNKGNMAAPAHPPTIVHQTVINKTVLVQHASPPPAPAVKPAAPPPPAPVKTMLASSSPAPGYRASIAAIGGTPSYRMNTAPATAMRSYAPATSTYRAGRR